MRKSVVALLTLFLVLPSLSSARAEAYNGKPKLVIILVLDQFRGDYLDRYRADFKTPNGFNLFLNKGAYFTDCYYDYANTITAPGHSTIGTGAYTDGHGISRNEWWDLTRSTKHMVSSVDDERYALVGNDDGPQIGASPRNELASTLGDEVVLATRGQSKLFGISLKDRAAILTSGHASKGAFWLDHASGKFISSTYWGPQLPDWVQAFNASGRAAQALKEANGKPGDFYNTVGKSPASVSYLLDFAKALITSEQMGRHNVTDVLTISISSTDLLGHQVGPDAPEQHTMIDAADTHLNDFFTWLNIHVDGGLPNVWVALTGDHGVAPIPAEAAKLGMPAASIDLRKLSDALDAKLNQRFNTSGKKYLLGTQELPYFELDPRPFTEAKIPEAEAEQAAADLMPEALEAILPAKSASASQQRLPPEPVLRHVYTKQQMATGAIPATEEGRRILHSYSPNGGWYVMTIFGMYELAGTHGTTHFTTYSYDRHVPLGLFGAPFTPSTYHGLVAPVDIAATFASLLGVNRPSAAVGNVLTQAIHTTKNATPASTTASRTAK